MSVATNRGSVSPVATDSSSDPGMPLWKRELILRKRTMQRTFPLAGLFSTAVVGAAKSAQHVEGEDTFNNHFHARSSEAGGSAVYLARDHAAKVHGWKSTNNNESDGSNSRPRSPRKQAEVIQQSDAAEVTSSTSSPPSEGPESAATQANATQRRAPTNGSIYVDTRPASTSPAPSPAGQGQPRMGEDTEMGHHPDLASRSDLALLNLCQPSTNGSQGDSYSDNEVEDDADGGRTYQYGPGIVNRLKSKFISLGLRDSPLFAGGPVRRVASLEQLLDMDDPTSPMSPPPTVASPTDWHRERPVVVSRQNKRYGPRANEQLLKRARSMETLSVPERVSPGFRRGFSRDDTAQSFPPPVNDNLIIIEHPRASNGDVNGGGTTKTPPPPLSALKMAHELVRKPSAMDNDDEFPKPDTVRTYKKLFETTSEDEKWISPISPSPVPPPATVKPSTPIKPAVKHQNQRRLLTPPAARPVPGMPKPVQPAKMNGVHVRPPVGVKPAPPTSPKPALPVFKTRPVKERSPTAKIADIPDNHIATVASNYINELTKTDAVVSVAAAQVAGLPEVTKEVVVNGFHHEDTVDRAAPSSPAVLPVYPPPATTTTITTTKDETIVGSSTVFSIAETFGSTAKPTAEPEPRSPAPVLSPAPPVVDNFKPTVVSSQPKVDERNVKPVGHVQPYQQQQQQKVSVVSEVGANDHKPALVNGTKTSEPMVNGKQKSSQFLVNGAGHGATAPTTNSVGHNRVNQSNTTSNSTFFDFTRDPNKVPPYVPDRSRGQPNPSRSAGSSYIIPGVGVTVEEGDDDYYNGGGGGGDSLRNEVAVFEGDNVIIGRSAFLKTRNKKLKLSFDDQALSTFEYPSEGSFFEEDMSSSYSDSSSQSSPGNGHSDHHDVIRGSLMKTVGDGLPTNSTLKSTPGHGSIGGLASYTPMALNSSQTFELGVTRAAPPQPTPPSDQQDSPSIKDSSSEEDLFLKPAADDENIVWSSAETSDILF